MDKKVLISKKIHSIVEKEQSFLKRENIKMFTATSKEESIDIHKKQKTDLIIIDLEMPKMSGEEFCGIVRDDEELQKVSIIVACPEDKLNSDDCPHCRANAFMKTPLDPPTLFDKVHQLLSIPRRVHYRTTMGVKIQGTYQGKSFLGFSVNISASGMLIEIDKKLNKGDLILCGFYIPDSMHVTSEAEIVRVVKKHAGHDIKEYGIKFVGLKSGFKSAIKDLVESQDH